MPVRIITSIVVLASRPRELDVIVWRSAVVGFLSGVGIYVLLSVVLISAFPELEPLGNWITRAVCLIPAIAACILTYLKLSKD
jgi:hypothetical protein